MKEKKSSYFTATWKMLAAVIIGGIAGGVSVVIYELMKIRNRCRNQND